MMMMVMVMKMREDEGREGTHPCCPLRGPRAMGKSSLADGFPRSRLAWEHCDSLDEMNIS